MPSATQQLMPVRLYAGMLALLLATGALAQPAASRDYLASIRPAPELQQFLDGVI